LVLASGSGLGREGWSRESDGLRSLLAPPVVRVVIPALRAVIGPTGRLVVLGIAIIDLPVAILVEPVALPAVILGGPVALPVAILVEPVAVPVVILVVLGSDPVALPVVLHAAIIVLRGRGPVALRAVLEPGPFLRPLFGMLLGLKCTPQRFALLHPMLLLHGERGQSGPLGLQLLSHPVQFVLPVGLRGWLWPDWPKPSRDLLKEGARGLLH